MCILVLCTTDKDSCNMSHSRAKGRDAMRSRVILHADPSDDHDFDLVAELSGCSRLVPPLRYFLCVLPIVTIFMIICYLEGSDTLEWGGVMAEERKYSEFSLQESTSVTNARDDIQEQNSTSAEMAKATMTTKLETTLSRLITVLDELDVQMSGRDLLSVDHRTEESIDRTAEGLHIVTGSDVGDDVVHTRSSDHGWPVESTEREEDAPDSGATTSEPRRAKALLPVHSSTRMVIGLPDNNTTPDNEDVPRPKTPESSLAGEPETPFEVKDGSVTPSDANMRLGCGTDITAFKNLHVPERLMPSLNAVLCQLPSPAAKSSQELQTWTGNWSGSFGNSSIPTTPEPRTMSMFRRPSDKNLHKRRLHEGEERKRRRKRERMTRKRRAASSKVALWLRWFGVAVCVFGVAMMSPGFNRGQGQQYPRQHAHVGDAGPPYVGTATLKVPPAWSVERNHFYSLRSWISDLVLWASATDVEAVRQGAIAAMQVTGSAKELVREIPPEQLAQGVVDAQTGQHMTGLMLLVQTLARRYSPLDGEAQTRAVSDFLNFQRLAQENVDAFLVRFDVLRNRAAVRGGLGLNHQGLAWLLLRALSVTADQLDRLLQPLNGNLPQDEAQLLALLERIRRQGHIYEGHLRHPSQQAGVGDPGTYHFYPTFHSATSSRNATGEPLDLNAGIGACGGGFDPWAAASFPTTSAACAAAGDAEDMGQYVGGASSNGPRGDDDRCNTCGSFFEDEEFSSATETDTGSVDEGIRGYNVVHVDGEARSDANARENELYQDYVLARRRWRRFTGKPPRRYRRSNFRASRNVSKLRTGPYARSYAAFLPPSAFAGGKGGHGSKGAGKGMPRKHPKGRDGQILRCSKCGSDEHLWRKCPQVVNKGGGKGVSTLHSTEMANAALALTASAVAPQAEAWHAGAVASAMPGVAFHYHVGTPRPASEMSSQAGGSRMMTALDEDIARLESVSQVSSNRSHKSRRSNVGPDSTPRWSVADVSSQPASSSGSRVETLQPGAPVPKHPPPSQPGPSAEELERQRTVLQLNSLLMAWWETDDVSRAEVEWASPQAGASDSNVYHLRTRLSDNRPGLLVDPGAHDNLVGDRTASRMEEIVGVEAKSLRMNKPLSVEGVGKNAQSAAAAKRMAVRLSNDEGAVVPGSFTAPVISDSDLPPLLGLKSLKSFRCILDIGNNKLIMPGPAGCEIQRCPGTVAYDLKMSDSGHLILPIDAAPSSASDCKGFDFQMSCRRGERSLSPQRNRR